MQTNIKKLQFGIEKCKKIHVGKLYEDYKCQPFYVDDWEEIENKKKNNGSIDIRDEYIGEEINDDSSDEKYLGEIISKDGRNIKNIKARVDKGKGIIKKN